MTFTLNLSLSILAWILSAFFIALGVMLVLCLIELRKVLQNFTVISNVYKDEAKPLLSELKNTLSNVQKITSSANSGTNIVKSILTGALGAGALMFSNLKNKKGGFLSGLISGFNMFRK